MSKLDTLNEDLTRALTSARDIAAKAEQDGNRDFTAEEREAVTKALADAKAIKDRIKEANGDEAMRKLLTGFDGIGIVDEKGEKKSPADYRPEHRLTIGEQFVDSVEYKALLSGFPSGRIPDQSRVQSAPVGYKALITGGSVTSAGAFVVPEQTGIYDPLGRRPLTIRDIISVRQTGSDAVEYVRQTARANAAAPVPEATTSGPIPNPDTANTAGLKPEGGFVFEKIQEPVKTIAEWVAATRRALSDAGQLRGIIDQELRADLAEVEEDQIINGSGVGENLPGILSTAGRQSQAWDTDAFVTTRRARRKVRVGGRAIPNVYLMHPIDWENIDLMRDDVGRFFGAGPFAMGTPTLWGLPVIESEAVPEGTALVGDFRRAVLWDREQANVSITDSHADFFVRNLIAVLAEERVAFGVTRPAAFVEIDLGPASA